MTYCHRCNNPILGNKSIVGDYNTFYHPVCHKRELEKYQGVQTMATYYVKTSAPTPTKPKNKKGK